MKNLGVMLILTVLALNVNAQEFNNQHKIYFEVGYSGGTYSTSLAGGLYGATGGFFMTGNKLSALDFRVKEVYINSPQSEAGAITFTYRLYLIKGCYIGAGFAHNHEIGMTNYMEDPLASTMGNGKYIVHRTGLAFESGYDFKPFPKNKGYGIYPVAGLGCSYMLFDNSPNPLIMMSIGFRFGVKKAT